MGDTGKDEAEFILIVGKFKTHNGDHREAGPWDRGAPHTRSRAPLLQVSAPLCSPDYEDPEPRTG